MYRFHQQEAFQGKTFKLQSQEDSKKGGPRKKQ